MRSSWLYLLGHKTISVSQLGVDVLGQTFSSARRACLDLASLETHREVGDERVLRLSRAVRGHHAPARLFGHVDGLDGVVHSIGFAPEAALGGNFLNTAWEDVAVALQVSAFSLKSLTMAARPLFNGGGSVVGLDFDAQVAWPKYDWMGVAKAALESTSRYLARDLGSENIRINLVAAGPIRTMAAKSIPGFDEFEKVWNERSPLKWDTTDPVPAAQATVALLSDWFPKTTAEIIHVDGGLHAMGA